ncbi:recombinase family protein [Candidatus Ishikawella capsulata]|nr:recombinase family protein [Candidatus Ishikawaella capsulata]
MSQSKKLIQAVRIYLRVSTDKQDLKRQEMVVMNTLSSDYYIAGIYREKASGARTDRPELMRMISDLKFGEIVIAEKIDRISRLPLEEAEILIDSIRNKGVKLVIPGIVDLTDLIHEVKGVNNIIISCMQNMLLKIALQMARDDYETRRDRIRQGVNIAKKAGKYKGRPPKKMIHEYIVSLRKKGHSIYNTAKMAQCSVSQVKRIWAMNKINKI